MNSDTEQCTIYVKNMAGEMMTLSASQVLMGAELYEKVHQEFYPESRLFDISLYRMMGELVMTEEMIELTPEEVVFLYLDDGSMLPFVVEMLYDPEPEISERSTGIKYTTGILTFYAKDEYEKNQPCEPCEEIAIGFRDLSHWPQTQMYRIEELPNTRFYGGANYSWGHCDTPNRDTEILTRAELIPDSILEHQYFQIHRRLRVAFFSGMISEVCAKFAEENRHLRL